MKKNESLVAAHEPEIVLTNDDFAPARPDHIVRLTPALPDAPALRISAEIATSSVRGVPGCDLSLFCNLEYGDAPIFWDTFLYPDTGTTPWRTIAHEVDNRATLSGIEVHIRHRLPGTMRIRRIRIEAMERFHNPEAVTVAIVGDSTDMTCYLPYPHRLSRRLELLLRDHFNDRHFTVTSLAEGGDHLKRLLESNRLRRELQLLPRCDIVILRYGLNDVNKQISADLFEKYLLQAMDVVRETHPDAQIVLSTTIPSKPLVAEYDERVRQVAAAHNLTLIDLHRHLTERSAAGDWDWHHQPRHLVGRQRTLLPPDNPTGLLGDLHPNLYGATVIAELYFEHLQALLPNLK